MLGACIRQGQIMTVVRKLARYKLVVVDVQWGRWDKGGTLRAGDYIFFYGKETKIINSEQYFLQHRTQIYDPCSFNLDFAVQMGILIHK